MKKYLIFLFISLLFLACKKEQSIHISAKNAVTGQPYPDLGYTITRVKTGLFSSHHKEVASGHLNENGEIYFTKRLDKNASYDIGLSQNPDNVCYINQASYTFGDGDKFDANFEFAECGYLKLNIHNVNCQGIEDTMVLYERNINIPDFYLQIGWPFVGCINFESDYDKDATGSIEMKWKVIRSGTTNTFYDTIYLNPGEYKTYNIEY